MTAPATSRVRVVVVDDDALVRSGLRMILGGSRELEIVGEAADGLEAEDVVAATSPDLVLLDVRMPRRDGLATARVLRSRWPALRVLVLTTFDTDDTVLEALRHGADGFLLKDTPPDRLVDAVLRTAAGEPTLSPAVTSRLIAAATGDSPTRSAEALERLARLTEREHEVALAVARGLSNTEVAAELFMSVPTVKSHVGRIFTKLEVDNRVQIANCVRDAGLG
ncbi:response regulator transcription factor [Sanguibacter sp. HDW7]|uniref:response regulator n=1 Tax=Sanguibacter sp. HDW7 TaxID=2714931 RepID=UPI00140779B1|nr:response regulator transcription factor [Sanguibacter sp. HDW7]QIK84170.1 response regulator transcription factor [Sanguibacter sp. HDW7]